MEPTEDSHTYRSFRYALSTLGTIALILAVGFVDSYTGLDPGHFLMGILVLVAAFFGISGTVEAFNSLKEPNHWKKWAGMAVNIGMIGLFVALIMANVMDIVKAFSG